MRVYNACGTYSELKGVPLNTNEDGANVIIAVSTEDAVTPKQAASLFLDAAIDLVIQMNRKGQNPDAVGEPDPFPFTAVIGKLLHDRGIL